ncbi:MAG: hypothetical protein K8L97_24675 [Anaerolineae bacterium]|nr:hypothetical protein [Anaerolineae bacterium]
MEKPKRDVVTPDMQKRLLINRDGKLTPGQWRDMITEPLVTLLLLMTPGIMVLGPRLGAMFFGGFTLIALLALVGLAVTVIFRAQRYARLPVHFEVFYAGNEFRPFWLFWRPQILYTRADKPMRFAKSLAPYLPLEPGQPYLVYYLKDTAANVLLSIAPADHPEAAKWQPSASFEGRYKRRSPS